MAEKARASVFETVQIGVESTPGTRVPAVVKLQGTDIRPKAQTRIKQIRAAGSKFQTSSVNGREHSEAAIEGDQSFPDLVYLFESNLCKGVKTTPVGATLTRRRVYKPYVDLPEEINTLTVERGNARDGGKRFAYGHIPDLTLNWSEDEATISGTVVGRTLDKGVPITGDEIQDISITGGTATSGTFTLALGGDASAPIVYNATASTVQAALELVDEIGSGNVRVTPYLNGIIAEASVTFNTQGVKFRIQFIGDLSQEAQGLLVATDTLNDFVGIAVVAIQDGTAIYKLPQIVVPPTGVCIWVGEALGSLVKLTNCEELQIQMNGRFVQQFVIDCGLDSFRQPVEKAPDFMATITVDDDSKAAKYLSYLRARKTMFLQIGCTSDEMIEAGFPYKMTWTMALRFEEINDSSQEEYEVSQFQAFGINDDTLGGALEVIIDTAIDNLNSPNS